MPRLDTCDVKEILDMLEDEINFIPNSKTWQDRKDEDEKQDQKTG